MFTFNVGEEGVATFSIAYKENDIERHQEYKFTVTNETYDEENEDSENLTLKGDANCDGNVDMGDVVLIMQALANPQKYGINGSSDKHITEQGIINGDVDDAAAGLTNNDALMIQKFLLGIIEKLN